MINNNPKDNKIYFTCLSHFISSFSSQEPRAKSSFHLPEEGKKKKHKVFRETCRDNQFFVRTEQEQCKVFTSKIEK